MHLMYVDESGDSGYPPDGVFPATGGPTRYFVRAGVVIHSWKWQKIDRLVADFKRARGLRWDAEIKATELRAGKGVFKGWSKENRRALGIDLLQSISKETDVNLLGVVIDKSRVDRQQRDRFVKPGVRSLELLLERYNGFLEYQKDKTGIVILDPIEKNNDENLRYFQSWALEFSGHLTPRRIVEGTLFLPSHTSNLLQLADVCTNVVYRHWTKGAASAEEYELLEPRIHVVKEWPEAQKDAAKER